MGMDGLSHLVTLWMFLEASLVHQNWTYSAENPRLRLPLRWCAGDAAAREPPSGGECFPFLSLIPEAWCVGHAGHSKNVGLGGIGRRLDWLAVGFVRNFG